MSIADWARGIIHPTYGKCGGGKLDCSLRKPIDEMDVLFQEHDQNLYQAGQLKTDHEEHQARKEADLLLYTGLLHLDPKKLGWYGRLYRRVALLVFKP